MTEGIELDDRQSGDGRRGRAALLATESTYSRRTVTFLLIGSAYEKMSDLGTQMATTKGTLPLPIVS